MAYNGAGVFSLVSGNPVVTGTVISSTWANNTLSDIANNGLSNCLTKDGQQTPTNNIPFGAFRLTDVGNAVNLQDAVTAIQVQNNGLTQLLGVAGTDTITAATAPATTAYVAGQEFEFLPVGTNATNAVTLNLNGLGAKNVTKQGTNALSPGDLTAALSVRIRYDGTQFQVVSPLAAQTTSGLVNRIINGGFDVWQRGASFSNAASAAGSYTADMWQCLRSAFSTNYTASQVSAGLAGSIYALRMQRTAGDTGVSIMQVCTAFETRDVGRWQGSQKTFSIQALGSGAFVGGTLTISATFGTGTDGNLATGFSGSFGTVSQTLILTNAYQLVSLSFQVPATATQMGVSVTYSPSAVAAGASDYFQIAQANLNEGGSVIPFERRPYALEFQLCERYYQVLQFGLIQAYQAAGTSFGQTLTYKTMRATPTAAFAGTPSFNNASGATLSTNSQNAVFFSATATALGNCAVNSNGNINLNASQ